jgi:hypothetical protein
MVAGLEMIANSRRVLSQPGAMIEVPTDFHQRVIGGLRLPGNLDG